MQLPDLYEFPAGHPPSPYNHPVDVIKSGYGLLPDGLVLRAVGWIDGKIFSSGEVDEVHVALLIHGLDRVFRDGYRGVHSCALCKQSDATLKWRNRKVEVKATGHYLLRLDKVVYVAPTFLLHYILDHQYRPPEEFLIALENGRFLTEDDLLVRWRAEGEI